MEQQWQAVAFPESEASASRPPTTIDGLAQWGHGNEINSGRPRTLLWPLLSLPLNADGKKLQRASTDAGRTPPRHRCLLRISARVSPEETAFTLLLRRLASSERLIAPISEGLYADWMSWSGDVSGNVSWNMCMRSSMLLARTIASERCASSAKAIRNTTSMPSQSRMSHTRRNVSPSSVVAKRHKNHFDVTKRRSNLHALIVL
mmetsp:Transcript_37503/g.74421  ORF Transcript_37503/g.74421 Transcript_37503/m.74421 type:complete len:204 (-) Transcript_37503:1025-1636(-)